MLELLAERWSDSIVPIGGPTVHPAIEQALAPFGASFPGQVPPLTSATSPGVVSVRAVAAWDARIGLVRCPRPPHESAHALSLAAELAAFCPDALWQGSDGAWPGSDDTITGLSKLLLHRPVWRIWFD